MEDRLHCEVVEVAGRERTRYRWVTIGAVASVWFLFSMDRAAVPAVLPYIRAEFGIDHDAAGLLGAIFLLTYTFGQFPAGVLADRLGAKKTLRIGTLALIATAFSGLAGSYQLLLLVRGLLGFGQAHYWSPLIRTVGQWTGTAERGRGISFIIVAFSAGAAFTPPLAALTISLTGNWRLIFWCLAAAGLIGAIILQRFVFDTPQEAVAKGRMDLAELRHINSAVMLPTSGSGHKAMRELLHDPMLWVFSLVAFFQTGISVGLSVWVVSFLFEQQGLGVVGSGLVAMIPQGTAVVATALGSWLLDRYAMVRRTIVLSTAAIVPVLYLVASAPQSLLYLSLLLVLIGALGGLPWGPIATYQMRRYPSAMLGRAAGIASGLYSVGGFITPVVAGYLVTGSREAGYSYQNVFLFLMALAICGAIAGVFLSPKPFKIRG